MAHHHPHKERSGLATAFWLNAVFSVIEVIGGIATNSTAILTDAIHDFGDTLAIGSGIFLEKVSGKKRTDKFSYGYKRFSLLSALLLSVFLLGGSLVMVVKAVAALLDPQVVDSTGMLWLAILGIVMNGMAFLKIKKGNRRGGKTLPPPAAASAATPPAAIPSAGASSAEPLHAAHLHASHSHSLPGSHNLNRRAIMLHLLEDVLGWAAVLVGALVIHFTAWYWVDPLLSIGIAVFIIFNASRNLFATMKIFLQAGPEHLDAKRLSHDILEVEGVSDVHDLHVWTLDGNYTVGTLHIVVEKEKMALQQAIRNQVERILDRHSIDHPTLQIEATGNVCRFINC